MAKRILVLENDEEHRQILCDIAVGLGYEAVGVERVIDALKVLQEQTISLIVLDVKMPGPYWGNHFLSHIRKQGKVTPVVVVSGYLRREIVEEIVTRQRVTAVLAKPFTVKRVASELHKALEGTAALGG